MSFNIRKGDVRDIPVLFALVEELAIYEKALHEVETSVESYLEDYQAQLFEFFVVEEKGEVRGIALYFFTYSTWKGKVLYLEDFVIFPEHRRKGLGRLLFNAVIEEAKQRHCKMMKWEVLDWNTDAIQFYEEYGATIEKNWWDGKLFFGQ